MVVLRKHIIAELVLTLILATCYGHDDDVRHSLSGSRTSSGFQTTRHHCVPKHAYDSEDHLHHHHHHHHQQQHLQQLQNQHQQGHGHDIHQQEEGLTGLLPEELAEEEDLKVYGLGIHHAHTHDSDPHECKLHGVGLWVRAISCSLLVSMASLVCLIILPLLFIQGKPSKTVVDSLAIFGAGAMLGDAFLHQLPHAFGGENSNSHDNHGHPVHQNYPHMEIVISHSHSLKDLSVGLSILAGIVVFLLVEKAVRYVEANAGGHSHHPHYHKKDKNVDDYGNIQPQSLNTENDDHASELPSKQKISAESLKETVEPHLRKRNLNGKSGLDAVIVSPNEHNEPCHYSTNLVFGYLNLISDGVHNFTDGMALGSAFLLYGSLGGWSRTIFLLAHELPQEIGDFGILVRSGFSVSKALFFNFLSALVALLGTALALLLGQHSGHSSLIEGFTGGGFIYIAVGGVLAEMNKDCTTLKTTAIHLVFLILGMILALCISIVE